MSVAPPVPAERLDTPWSPWCWLEVQVATATGSTGDPDRVGYWQPATVDTADPRYSVWMDDSVTPPPAGDPVPVGYGEWVQGNTGTKWGLDWNTISWRSVDCNLMGATFSTGANPWEWNASPGNGTLRLDDPDHTYFPAGPGSGYFDDIGVNTPIRVIAHLTAAFDQVPTSASRRTSFRILITGLIRSIEHELTPTGLGTTTIHFSEPHVLYGRVNCPATPVNAGSLDYRFGQIHGLSDDPLTALIRQPRTADTGWDGGTHLQTTEISSDLWTEICKSANSLARSTALRLYPASTSNQYMGSPRVFAFIPVYPPNLTDPTELENYGLDVRTLSQDCSPDETTFNYTTDYDAARVKIRNCPAGSITFGHDDDQLANSVSIAATGGTATVVKDQASIDRFYLHSYQRHDLIHLTADTPLIAARYLDRLVQATFHMSDCSYFIAEPRDFEFALGASPRNSAWQDHPPVEPGRWINLDWGWVTANLRVTKIAHQISPTAWTVTHSYEIHNPVTHQESI